MTTNTMTIEDSVNLGLKLPWEANTEQDEKFTKLRNRLLLLLLIFLVTMHFMPSLEKEEEEKEVVKVEMKLDPVRPLPEPEVIKPPVKKVKKPEPQPIVKKEVKPKPKPKAVQPKPVEKVVQVAKKNKPVATKDSVSDFAAQFSQLDFSMDMTKIRSKNVSNSTKGTVAKTSYNKLGDAAITKKSQGINVSDDAMLKTKGVALASHKAMKLDGFNNGGGGSATSDTQNFFDSKISGQRSDESIRRVFELGKNKAYLHYLKALKSHDSLAGTLVFSLVIEPEGHVSQFKLISSELNDPALEKKIMNEVNRLHFGAMDVEPRNLIYKFNFLPS